MIANYFKAQSVLLLAILQICACSPSEENLSKENPIEEESHLSTGEIYFIDRDEMKNLEDMANSGDKKAIDAIINHYQFAQSEFQSGPLLKWLIIAYNKGDTQRLRDIVFYSSDSDLKCGEILYFYRKLESADPKSARELARGRVAQCLRQI